MEKLKLKGKVCTGCISSCMMHSSEDLANEDGTWHNVRQKELK